MAFELKTLRNLFGVPFSGTIGNVANPNYQLYAEVQVSTDDITYVKTTSYLLDPLTSVSNIFVVNDGFKGQFINPDFNPWDIDVISKVTYNRLFGKIYGAEFWGEPGIVQTTPVLIGEYLMLKGGVQHAKGWPAALTQINSQKKFLTWHPDIKVVSALQPEIIHFLIQTDTVTAVNLKVQIYYTDLTDTTITAKTLGSIDQWDILRIPAGVTNLDLEAVTPSKVISHYDIWLENQANAVISEVKTYEIDQYTYFTERFWMYVNSLGMPEIFRTYGRAAIKNSVKYNASKRMVTYDNSPKTASYQINSSAHRSEWEMSTGFIRDRETAYYMLDFLSQRSSLYLLRDNDYFPYQMLGPSTHDVEIDDEFNYYLRFKVLGAFEENTY